jgi:hypothetical protein
VTGLQGPSGISRAVTSVFDPAPGMPLFLVDDTILGDPGDILPAVVTLPAGSYVITASLLAEDAASTWLYCVGDISRPLNDGEIFRGVPMRIEPEMTGTASTVGVVVAAQPVEVGIRCWVGVNDQVEIAAASVTAVAVDTLTIQPWRAFIGPDPEA